MKTFKKVDSFFKLSTQLGEDLSEIEKKVIETEISPETRDNLYHDLDETSVVLTQLKDRASSIAQRKIFPSLSEYEERIINLYGRIHNLSVDFEVARIKEKAIELDTCIDTKKMAGIIKQLKKHIAILCESNALSRINCEVIANAKMSLQKAEARLKGKKTKKTASLPPPSETPADLEEIVEFFEIAHLFYQHKQKLAVRQFNQLPEEQKKLFRQHMKDLGKNPDDLESDTLRTIQALIASAFDLSHCPSSDPYFSKQQIQTFFSDLEAIEREEQNMPAFAKTVKFA